MPLGRWTDRAADEGTARRQAVSVSRARRAILPGGPRLARRRRVTRRTTRHSARMGSAEPHETRALARYAFEELRGGVGGVHEIHRAIAGRAFRAVGPGALPARAIHDAITRGVYGGLRGATSLLARTAEAGLRLRPVGDPRWLSTSPRGALVLGALNGLIGDALERERSDLEQTMAVRVGGRPVEAEPASLAATFPRATPRMVIFLHGLMETELAWRLGAGLDGETPRPARSARSCAAGVRASAICGRARWSTTTGVTAIRSSCEPPPAARCRCWRAPPTAS